MDVTQQVLETNSFKKFNPMQEQCIKHVGENLVVSAPTASGKTIVAELFILDQVMNKKKKVIYTCPLRALASEHYNDFKKKYSGLSFALSTGDIDSNSSYLKKFDIIFTTYEKLASLLRHKSEWLQQVGCLIIDELHEIDSDRGPVLEIATTQLRNKNKGLVLLGLSATIPNSKELSEWLDASLVESDFRPVKLKEGISLDKKFYYKKGEEEKELETFIEENLEQNKQALFFMNSRKRAEGNAKKLIEKTKRNLTEKEKEQLEKIAGKVLNVLEQPTEQCSSLANCIKEGSAFHHAGLVNKQRTLVEDAFKEKKIKIISATPTLAAGINAPADIVVIPTLYRYGKGGMKLINVREYKQMCFTKNTLISTEHGMKKIVNIVKQKQPIKVKSFNTKTKKIELKPILTYYENEPQEIIELEFSNFKKIKCTPNHPFCTLNHNKFIWKNASQLKNSDTIVIKKEISKGNSEIFFYELLPNNCFVLNQGNLITEYCKNFNCTEKDLSKKLKLNYKRMYHIKTNKKAMPLSTFKYTTDKLNYNKNKKATNLTHIKSKGGKLIIFPEKLTEDFLWLVGLIATDGNINQRKNNGSTYTKIRLFNSNKKIITKAKKILKEFNITPYEIVQNNNIRLEFGGTLLAEILDNYFGIPNGNKTTILKTPKIIENLSPNLIGAYLSGVFDGDGNYSKTKQKKEKQSYSHRIIIVTASKNFARGLITLFDKIGIIPTVNEYLPKTFTIRGEKIKFKSKLYNITFRKIEYIKKFYKYSSIVKANLNINYSKVNNVNKRDFSNKNFDKLKLVNTKKKSKENTYNLEIEGNNNYFVENILVHNCGRSGRPKFSTEGKSIIKANSEDQKDLYLEKYLNGEMEPVLSKLSIIPVLRTHVLGLIATNDIYNDKSIWKFFEKTLYSKQLSDIGEIFEKVTTIIDDLEEKGFVEKRGEFFTCTAIGKRISDLFLDPESAYTLISALQSKKEFNTFSYLYSWCNCYEFYPLFRLPKKLEPIIWEEFNKNIKKLPFKEEQLFFENNAMEVYFSAFLLNEWINEKREQELFEKFGLSPGALFGKNRIIEWLAYATVELSKVLDDKRHIVPSKRIALRTKYGVREELLQLVELRGIGRARARKLYNADIKRPSEIKKDFLKVEHLLGEAVTNSLKKQLKVK